LQSQEVLEDNYSSTRQIMRALGIKAEEWCGLPVPIADEKLIVEPSHPASSVYAKIGREDPPEDKTIINTWYSYRHRSDIVIYRDKEGKLRWGLVPGIHSLRAAFSTMGCSIAWTVEEEERALLKLSTLIPDHLFKMYLLSGMFIETSKRSGLTYIFRKLRPTVALTTDKTGEVKILCALCLHPIGYYEGTWAGSMCPTDDVIAHLLMMRADEHFYWKRANQIRAHRPEAGL